MYFDVLIENGMLVDGTGIAARRADVGVSENVVAAAGDLKDAEAGRRLDATGCVVAPGFIDIHNHSDLVLLADGRAESMIRQGVTTLVTGNCGLTPAPVHDAVRDDLRKTMIGPSYGSWRWNTFGQFLGELRAAPKATHVAPLVGHGAIPAVPLLWLIDSIVATALGAEPAFLLSFVFIIGLLLFKPSGLFGHA